MSLLEWTIPILIKDLRDSQTNKSKEDPSLLTHV